MALTAEEWFQIGSQRYEDDLYEEAIEAFSQAIEIDQKTLILSNINTSAAAQPNCTAALNISIG